MGLWSSLRGLIFGRPSPAKSVRAISDAAQTTSENREHWVNADSLSANAAYDPLTRRKLRERSRYEAENNAYFRGLIDTIAADLIGTGPRLQVQIPGDDSSVARLIEVAFGQWWRHARMTDKLRVLHSAKLRDGECFAVMSTNRNSPHAVKLAVTLYEAEIVAAPFGDYTLDPLQNDGVLVDEWGEPVKYSFRKGHPGGVNPYLAMETQDYDARYVLHWFRADRPGQTRGVPELACALPLFSQLRRYTLATLTAAEFAAMFAGVLKTESPAPDGQNPVDVATMDEIPMTRGALLTLPYGWDATQFESKQKPDAYRDFKGELLNEIGRAVCAPFNVIAGNSSGYNYSSGRLDHLIYHRMLRSERERMRDAILDRLLSVWLDEATLAGVIPMGVPPVVAWSWSWHWDGFDSIDPKVDAETDEIELRINTTTLKEIWARKGLDADEQLAQIAREREMLAAVGGSPGGETTTIPLTPTDIATVVTVDEARSSIGQQPIGGSVGAKWVAEQAASLRENLPVLPDGTPVDQSAPAPAAPVPTEGVPA